MQYPPLFDPLKTRARDGFTLIEMSMVLVIVALLVGGVIVGKELIRQSELRSIVSDWQRFEVARISFRTKYNCLPGDCPVASRLSLGSDGDGNGYVSHPSWGVEHWQFWRHLGAAGLIFGNYTGTAGPGNVRDVLFGVNSPQSRISGVGYVVFCAIPQYASWSPVMDAWGTTLSLTSHMYFVGRDDNSSNDLAGGGFLSPPEAKALDSKVDDGIASKGQVRSRDGIAADNTLGCVSGAAPNYDYTASSSALCNLSYWYTF